MLYKGSRIPRQRNRRLSVYLLNRIRAHFSFGSAVDVASDGICVDCASPTQKCRCPRAPDDVLRRGTVKGSDGRNGHHAKFVVSKAPESSKKGRLRKKKKVGSKIQKSIYVEEERMSDDSIPAPAPSLEEIKSIDHPEENRLSLHEEPPPCQWSLQDKNCLVPQPPGSPPNSPPRAHKGEEPTAPNASNTTESERAKALTRRKKKRKKLLRGIRKRLGRLRKRWRRPPRPTK